MDEKLHDYLAPESAAQLEAFAQALQDQPAGRQQLWVPHNFVARRWDHSVFPAEATLSRFKRRDEVFHTLIESEFFGHERGAFTGALTRREGRFREDLYFRLHVFPIHLPPLRDRGKDIEWLAETFILRISRRMGKRLEPLTPDQLRLLRDYDWPGNVRELQNVVEPQKNKKE